MAEESGVVSAPGSLSAGPESVHDGSLPPAEPHLPPVAGFWRRVAAFTIDGILLGILGQVLGWTLSSWLFDIGPYGRLIGFAISLAYFGLMDSRIGDGQTLGKRLLHIGVTDENGDAIGIGASMLRTCVWLVPVTLNRWALPLMSLPAVSAVASFIIFGVGMAVALTMVFNRRTRQGIHDLLVKSYVLKVEAAPSMHVLPVAGRLPWILSASALAVAVLFWGVGGLLLNTVLGERMSPMTELYDDLQSDRRFFSASVMEQNYYSAEGVGRVLLVEVWHKGKLDDSERVEVIKDVGAQTIEMDGVEEYDLVRVSVVSAFDVGIATGHVSMGYGGTVEEWRSGPDAVW